MDIFTVFNIAGNNYRFVSAIKYRWQIVYIRRILTHADYDKEMGNMSATLLDEREYRKLLDEALPVAIRTEEEYQRQLGRTAALMEEPENEISEEEGRLLEPLSILIEEYENRAHPLPKAKPHKMLAYLLKEKNMKPSDLWTVLPKSRVSEILSGKRGISKAQAKQLAELFRVPIDLFV